MSKIIIPALILWAILYIFLILRACFKCFQIVHCLVVLSKYLSIGQKLGPFGVCDSRYHDENYRKTLEDVLRIYPNITKILGVNIPALDYGYSDLVNHDRSVVIYNKLLMKRNFQIFNVKASLNPFKSLKLLAMLPGKFLEYLGIRINAYISKFFSLLVWLAAYLLGIYSDEIKYLINSLFQ